MSILPCRMRRRKEISRSSSRAAVDQLLELLVVHRADIGKRLVHLILSLSAPPCGCAAHVGQYRPSSRKVQSEVEGWERRCTASIGRDGCGRPWPRARRARSRRIEIRRPRSRSRRRSPASRRTCAQKIPPMIRKTAIRPTQLISMSTPLRSPTRARINVSTSRSDERRERPARQQLEMPADGGAGEDRQPVDDRVEQRAHAAVLAGGAGDEAVEQVAERDREEDQPPRAGRVRRRSRRR